ncbi:MAG: hypothetical protein M0026_10165 [Nocardiopsaceae bacterium]|nr:hypothetical protein [Nocardiopsaceae bacterium]
MEGWMIAAAAALAVLFSVAVGMFARSVVKARTGGQARKNRAATDAARIRASASAKLVEARTKLPQAREDVRRAREAGTLRRTAADLLERAKGLQAAAKRLAQSYRAFSNRHENLLDRLDKEGVLLWENGAPTLDADRFPPGTERDVAFLQETLRTLRDYRNAGAEQHITGPLSTPVAITEQDVREVHAHLDSDRVDEVKIRELTREAAFGSDMLHRTDAETLREMTQGRRGLPRRVEVGRASAHGR